MIIFDLETLADDSHRRHFIDPRKRNDVYFYDRESMHQGVGWYYKNKGSRTFEKHFEPNWQAYQEACDKDKAIEPVCDILRNYIIFFEEEYSPEWFIWCNSSESLKEKTYEWLRQNVSLSFGLHPWKNRIKMRPIGNDRPSHVIKEEYLQELEKNHRVVFGNAQIKCIQMAFASDPESIAMYRKHDIFVFDCRQK